MTEIDSLPAHIRFIPAADTPGKAITVVVHGLNNRPDSMLALAGNLAGAGSDVVLASLSGHRDDRQAFAEVQEQVWIHDMMEAYMVAKRINQPFPDRPVYFVGYSLGALVNLSLISRHPDQVVYTRLVLLAPATHLKWHSQLLRLLFRVGRTWHLPSLTPAPYQANRRTPVQAYKALFALRRSLEQSGYRHLHIPTLVLIDPRDELINVRALRKSLGKYQVTEWQVRTVYARPTGKGPSYRHLILDERCLGPDCWQQMKTDIRAFLEL